MTATPNSLPDRRELDHRHGDGIDVMLSWSPAGDQFYVTVLETHEAVDVFDHPYAYAAHRESLLLDVAA